VLQGERPMAADNKSLGQFILDGIPPAPRGVPQIEVTFDIDANGILKVTAKDKATGRSQHITITASSGLSEEEVEQMKKDAEAHADDDLKRKELIEAQNHGDNTAYAAEKALKEFGDKVPEDTRTEIEAKVAEVRKAVEGDDVEAMKSLTGELGQLIQKIGASVYEGQEVANGTSGAEAPQSGEADPSSEESGEAPHNGEEEVIDGEVEE
jgi:molecular chaperone DnaK